MLAANYLALNTLDTEIPKWVKKLTHIMNILQG